MGTGVFFNLPAYGHVNPTLPVVRNLVARGERILYFDTPEFKEKIEATGAEFRDYGFGMPAVAENRRKGGNFVQLAGVLLGAAEKGLPHYIEEVERLAPDYIIHDSMCPWGKYIAAYLGIRAINTTSTFIFTKGTLGKAGGFGGKVVKMARESGAAGVSAVLRSKKKLERQYGLKIGIMDIFRNTENLNLVFTSRYFQPGGDDFGAEYEFIGPSIADRNDAPGFAFDFAAADPLVYISLGTLENDRLDFYVRCIKACAEMDFHVLISIGRNVKREELGSIPPNISVVEYAPQLEVLKHAQLFLSHAGMNSVNESLYFGVPLLLFPQQQEQVMVARRVEEKGAGICMPADGADSGDIRAASRTVLESRNFYENARKVSDSFKASGGYERGAELILRYAFPG
ncbi:MAG: glycosyltransferase [Rectinema sp.]